MTRDEVVQKLLDAPSERSGGGLARNEPEPPELWALLSDVLQQQGDPRGELIAVDLALESAKGEQHETLTHQRAAYLEAYGPALLGEVLAKVVKEKYGTVTWRRGFVTELAYVGNASLGHQRSVRWLVAAMARQPEPLTFLRRLTLTHTDLSDATLLGTFKGLVEVDVSRTQVASLEWVALLPRLEAVKLKGAAVNRATLDAAKKQFPRLRLG